MKKVYIFPNIKVKEVCIPSLLEDSKAFQTKSESSNGGDGNSAPGMGSGGTGTGSDMNSSKHGWSLWSDDDF